MKIVLIILLVANGLIFAQPQYQAAHVQIAADATLRFDGSICKPEILDEVNDKQHSFRTTYSNLNGELVVKYSKDVFEFADGTKVNSTVKSILNNENHLYGDCYLFPKVGTDKLYFLERRTKWVGNNSFTNLFVVEIDTIAKTLSAPLKLFPTDKGFNITVLENQAEDGYWVLTATSDQQSEIIESYVFDNSGINLIKTNRIKTFRQMGITSIYGTSFITSTPSGNLLALGYSFSQLLVRFNRNNGEIGEEILFNLPRFFRHGSQFSSNEKYLYLNLDYSGGGTSIVQVDISSWDKQTIENSIVDIALSPSSQYQVACNLVLTPNGKIYFTLPRHQVDSEYKDYLGVINCPDLKYPDCNVNPFHIEKTTGYWLDRFPSTWFQKKNVLGESMTYDMQICPNSPIFIDKSGYPCTESYWELPDGEIIGGDILDMDKLLPSQQGRYRYIRKTCGDSIVHDYRLGLLPIFDFSINVDTLNACFYDSTLVSITPLPDRIVWSNGSEEFETYYHVAGQHSATFYKGECMYVENFEIEVNAKFEYDLALSRDTFCYGDSVFVEIIGDFEDKDIIWSNGKTGKQNYFYEDGEHYAVVHKNECSDTAKFSLEYFFPKDFAFSPDTLTYYNVCVGRQELTNTLTFTNISGEVLTLKGINISGTGNITFSNVAFPILINSNENIELVFTVNNTGGNYSNDIILAFEECGLIKEYHLDINIGESLVNVSIEDLDVEIGEIIRIPILVKTKCYFSSSQTRSLKFNVSYDFRQFHFTNVEGATLLGNNRVATNNELLLEIEHQLEADILEFDTLIYVNGVVLLSPVRIAEIDLDIESNADVKQNSQGKLLIDEICVLEKRLVEILSPLVFTHSYSDSDKVLLLEIGGGFEDDYNINIINGYGVSLESKTLPYSSNSKSYIIDMSQVASGVYYIQMSNGMYHISDKVLIVK